MPRGTAFSVPALAVLAALAARPSGWRHGYDLVRETGLKPGTLYPILVRLADRGIVQACRQEGEPAGRPGATCTRLTSDGTATGTAALAVARAPAARAARPGPVAAPRWLAGEGS
jgi:PadR family transcriptional regulator PadR